MNTGNRIGAVQWFGQQATATLNRLIDAKMDATGRAVVEQAKAYAHVITGQNRDSIGYTYNRSTRTLQVHADMRYSAVEEFRPGHAYLRPALNAAGKVWGGNTELHFSNSAQPGPQPATGKKAEAAARVNAKLGRGASGRAKIVYRRGHSRWADAEAFDGTMPIL